MVQLLLNSVLAAQARHGICTCSQLHHIYFNINPLQVCGLSCLCPVRSHPCHHYLHLMLSIASPLRTWLLQKVRCSSWAAPHGSLLACHRTPALTMTPCGEAFSNKACDSGVLCWSGHQASQAVSQATATLTVQPLYLILSADAEQCRHLLGGTHTLTDGYMTSVKEGFHGALRHLHSAALPVQLMTVACLALLCTQVHSSLFADYLWHSVALREIFPKSHRHTWSWLAAGSQQTSVISICDTAWRVLCCVFVCLSTSVSLALCLVEP